MASFRVDCLGIRISHRNSNIIRWTAACLFSILTVSLLVLQIYLGTICSVLFIYFVLTFVFRGHTDPFPRLVRIIAVLLVILATSVITALPWIVFGGREECRVMRGTLLTPRNRGFEDHWLELILRYIFVWLLATLTVYITLGDHPPSAHIRQTVRCIMFVWFGKLIHIITVTVDACRVPEHTEDGLRPGDAYFSLFAVFGLAAHYVADVWFLQLVVERLVAFQAAYGETVPFTCIILWLSRVMILMVTMQSFGVLSRWVALINSIALSLGVVVLSFLLNEAYVVPFRYLWKARKLDVNNAFLAEVEKETIFAMRIIRKCQLGGFVGTWGMVLGFMSFGLDFFVLPRDKSYALIYVVASNLDALGITASLAVLSGVNIRWCINCSRGENNKLGANGVQGELTYYSQKSWNFTAAASRSAIAVKEKDEIAADWQNKVADLAMRRISVEVLLEFYLQLGEKNAMPHFDPKRSTTNDVVRHAVIPQSRDGKVGQSFAEKFGPQKASRSPRMVTHHWSNHFCDLVAAVVADALGLKRWDLVSEGLKSPFGGEELKEQLYAHGSLHWQYWICALCINQHASICGTSMGVRDTVTQEVLPSCDCETPKYLNDHPIQCELNKFDDMMAYLHRTCPKFLQVVAIDVDFMIFSRAWCVAELLQADASHLEQHMMIHSPSALEKNSGRLKSIQVQDCSASRQEDKLAILAKIGGEDDIQKFNQRLQHILLGNGGLLANWLDGQKLLQEVGSICARAKARVEASSSDAQCPEV